MFSALKMLKISAIVISSVVLLTGCSSSSTTESSQSPTASAILTMELPDDVTAKGVVLAAVIMKAGNVEEAVANGLVTPAEVDYALEAVEFGLLEDWKNRAEADLK